LMEAQSHLRDNLAGALVIRSTLVATLILISACSGEAPKRVTGQTCELTTECAEPLVCRLSRCRRECSTFRDCAAGAECVLDDEGRGACLFEEENLCALDSQCREVGAGLVCRDGRCRNECVEDRDCPSGASCVMSACVVPDPMTCVYNSDCPILDGGTHEVLLVCNPEQRCVVECNADRDCDFPRTCVRNLCELPDGGAP
jgi:hypothetical protein